MFVAIMSSPKRLRPASFVFCSVSESLKNIAPWSPPFVCCPFTVQQWRVLHACREYCNPPPPPLGPPSVFGLLGWWIFGSRARDVSGEKSVNQLPSPAAILYFRKCTRDRRGRDMLQPPPSQTQTSPAAWNCLFRGV